MQSINPIQKILVFRLSSIGDIILTSALIRCLRNTFPSAQIDFVIKKQFIQLVEHNPHINNVYVVDKNEGFAGLKRLKQTIAHNKYDVFLDIHKNMRSMFIKTGSRANTVLTFKKRVLKRTLLTAFGIDTFKTITPTYMKYIEAAKSIGVSYDGNGTEIFIPQKDIISVQQILQEHAITKHDYVVLCPGASFKNKQWLPERFAELASRIIQNQNINVVLIGGKAEQDICKMILETAGNRVLDLSGRLSLMESGAVLSMAKTIVSNDTGMLLMAEALKIPVVGIYGPTARQFGFYPILEKSRWVEVDIPCRPCTKMGKNTCPKKHWKCMRLITTNMVYDSVLPLIK